MKRTFILVGALLLAQIGQAANYYVSKTGNDSNAGTSSSTPFLTIQKAAARMVAGDTCYIFSGTYRETVTPTHSGSANSRITFTAYPGETPIVSGADVLNLAWNVYSNSIYVAAAPAAVSQLFVDGNMMNIARWPNAAVNRLLFAPRAAPTSVSLTNLTDNKLPSGISLTGAYLHFFDSEYGNQGFTADTRQITGWNPSTRTITWSGNVQEADSTGCLYYIYGDLSLLDIPTEWYYNSANEQLYLWCSDSASPSTHIIETKTRTSAFTLDNLSYVTVQGLFVFAAGISMANTTHCVVDGCNLIYVQHNLTADWTRDVPIANRVSGSGSMWINSVINYSSQDGIRLSGQNEVVSNCVIDNVDYYPGTYYAAVSTYSGGSGTTVIDNTLWYSGRYGVGVSSTGANVGSNDIGYGDLLTSDGGGTYEYVGQGDGGGTRIHHNWVHNCWAGVYVDAFQSNYMVYRNVCYSNYVGMLFNQFDDNVIVNNTSINNSSDDIQFSGSADTNVKLINNLWNTSRNSYNSSMTVTDDGWYPPIGSNFVPQAGSHAIDGGAVFSPYTDGYSGSAPDIGAYETGGDYWVPGANFTPQPFPLAGGSNMPPFITIQPQNQTYYFGQTATLSAAVAGNSATSYQWKIEDPTSSEFTNLPSGIGQYSPATNATLYITNLTATNAGSYEMVASNSYGATTSLVAVVTVLSPAPSIATAPANQTNTVGQTATFTVAANGVGPFGYQWRTAPPGSQAFSDLSNLGGQFSGTTNTTLYISNVVAANGEDYDVIVTNAYGSVTSAVATLTVLTMPPYLSVVLADHPISYWPMNENSGTIIHDVVGVNDGTCVNPAGLPLGGPGVLAGQGVASDVAIYFTNTPGAYVSVPYSATLNTPQLSMEAWLNLPTFPVSGAGADMNPLSFDDAPAPNGWALEIPSPNAANPVLEGWLASTGGGWTRLNSGPCPQSKWTYYVMTYDGTTFCIYTNGVLAASHASTYAQVGADHPLFMGAYDDSGTADRFYQGGMENVAVYSNALSANRILAHYMVGAFTSPIVSLQFSAGHLAVSWNHGFLQEANNIAGPWIYSTNATSPYSLGTTAYEAHFFRVTLLPPPSQ